MSPAADASFVGINWGSSAFRAYLIAADGRLLDNYANASGVTALDRNGMAAQIAALAERWPDRRAIYASGMIGSNVGWVEAPYAEAPADLAALAAAMVATTIGDRAVTIVPGIACRREADGAPDILRGEEIELFGLAKDAGLRNGFAGLPGTHTKWVRLDGGRVVDFLTSMSGELFDRLTRQGLLASVVEGEATAGEAFAQGLAVGEADGNGLAASLFGVRARVIRGDLARADAASYARGVLIGAEIAGVRRAYPALLATGPVPLIGNGPLSQLYASALARVGAETSTFPSQDACVAGFVALHAAVRAGGTVAECIES